MVTLIMLSDINHIFVEAQIGSGSTGRMEERGKSKILFLPILGQAGCELRVAR